ncbi:hypothetical protein FB451DRAFT_1399793 [Mycena latifolia]|nr:hypothetical protein FB451DRAFT_1399793 [Mycena latifolia]
MIRLPNELLDRICSFLAKRELWAVLQVSAGFRSVAMYPFLSRFGISQSDIQSGTLSLSDSFHLILVVARIRPIQRLVCFKEHNFSAGLRYQRVATILSMTAPIPDIVVYNRMYMLQRPREAIYFLSRIPQAATDSFLFVKGNSMRLSRPRLAPPIRWKLLPPPLGQQSNYLSPAMKTLLIVFGIPLLFAYLVSGIVNCGVLIVWVYRRLFGPGWPHAERIAADAGRLLVVDDWMRIQALPGRLTLITLTEQRSPVLTLRPFPGLAKDIYSTLLPVLDLGLYLAHLRVEAKTDLAHADLLAFIQRHSFYLTQLSLQPNSLRASSLLTLPIPRNSESRINVLMAPAPYIPHLLPAAPNVQKVHIPFQPSPSPKHAALTAPAFDLAAYHSALAALATLPGTPPLTLTLAVRLTASSLPWSAPDPPAASASASSSDTTTALPRLAELALCTDGPMRFRAPTIRALVPWLARFPGLQRVSFAHGAVEHIPLVQRTVLAEAICAACASISSVRNVAFNILDD